MLPRTDARGPPDVRFVLSRMGSVQAAPDARPLPPLPPPALPYVPAVEAVSPAPRKRLSGAGPGAADVELAGAAPDSEDVPMAKRHQTRANASRRQLTADTVLHSLPDGEVIPDDAGVSCDEDDGPAGQHDHAGALLPAHNIEIPNIVTLEEGGGREPMEEGNGEEEDVSDARMARLHLVYEIKEQALRENLSGARNRRFPVRKAGPVSSTELLFAPDIESRLSESDHLEVLGKVVHDVAVPEERLALITDKLEEKEKSYAQAPKHFTRFFLHTQWAPEVRIERAPAAPAPAVAGAPDEQPAKPRLLIKLTRLSDKKL